MTRPPRLAPVGLLDLVSAERDRLRERVAEQRKQIARMEELIATTDAQAERKRADKMESRARTAEAQVSFLETDRLAPLRADRDRLQDELRDALAERCWREMRALREDRYRLREALRALTVEQRTEGYDAARERGRAALRDSEAGT